MTKIEWTEQTWNPIAGCSLATPGCTNCYAMRQAHRMASNPKTPLYHGTTKVVNGKPVWTGKMNLSDTALLKPLKRKKPTTWFVNSMSDLFHEELPDEWIDQVFAVMALCPQHRFQVLTKRADRMREYVCSADFADVDRWATPLLNIMRAAGTGSRFVAENWPLPNVWLGVSVEDQKRADERIPDLLSTPAAIRFVSCEPLLGAVNFLVTDKRGHDISSLRGIAVDPTDPEAADDYYRTDRLDWVIVGGESGPGARPMHPDWARSLRDQCAAADVPFFFKQWGEWSPVAIDEEDDGSLTPAYPIIGCGSGERHDRGGECLFWQNGNLVHWPHLVSLPAVGVRNVGKRAAGRLLDGREHREMPSP